jgi:outer membrane protein assembly factor BamB
MRSVAFVLVFGSSLGWTLPLEAGDWPQFRGPRSGLAVGDERLPVQIGPDQNVLWQSALPPGHSSPVVHGDRIYLTGMREKALVVLALDRKSGAIAWEVEVPHKQLEKIHAIGSHAQSTPVTDGKHIISFFGSSGLLCHDRAGKLLWHLPMGPFKNDFGAASSPILVGDVIILNQDHDSGSFLMAVDKHTGKVRWRTDRSEFPVGYASPVIWEVEGRKQIVIAGTLRVVGYDFGTGKELWTVAGMARVMNMTPSVGPDGTLYVAGWAAGADADDRFPVPGFDEMLARYDTDKNGTLELNELPEGPIKQRFTLIDRDKDGHITRVEYEGMRQIFLTAQNRLIAIKPGGHGDLTKSNVLWTLNKHLPFVPSPLLYKQHLFLVKNGGIVSSVDCRSGKPIRQERVRGGGDYYSSPVGGDGKVYFFSQRGHANVISAEGQWRLLASSKFDEEIYATPAIVDGRIYLRTTGRLYCFGLGQ